jgi:ketosteroid isomerase-like protein
MKNVTSVFLIISVLFFLGCGEQKLSQEELEDIKEEIKTLISEVGAAYETGNVEYFKNAASNDIIGFGTEEVDVYTNLDEWVEAFQKDFQFRDSTPSNIKFEESRNVSIQISETGDMATVISETPYKVNSEGKIYPGLSRIACTLRMENGEWKIVQWLGCPPVE